MMLRLRKNRKNIFFGLRDREVGNAASAKHLDYNVLYQLIASGDREFKKVWMHGSSRHSVACEDGKIYLHAFDSCLSLWGYKNIPSFLYRFEKFSAKIVDAITCAGRHCSTDPGPLDPANPKTYRNFFLALYADNRLRQWDNKSGKLLQEIYLDSPSRYKFQTCSWETFGNRVLVMCDLQRMPAPNVLANSSRGLGVLGIVVLFSVFPLEFVAKMEITSSVFGKNVKKVNVTEGTLVIGKGQERIGRILIYDFNHILENDVHYHAKLHSHCALFDNQIVGMYPYGIPINCRIRTAPPLLFDVSCNNYSVHFGGIPYHYVVMDYCGNFHIFALGEENPVAVAQLCCEAAFDDYNQAYFHHDNSERLFFECPHAIKVYKLQRNNEQAIKQLFSMSFSTEAKPKVRSQQSRSLRQLPEKEYFHALKSIMDMDYDNELDMIAVLGFDPRDAGYDGKVNLYDNVTGRLLRTISINYNILETQFYELVFNLDTLVLIAGKKTPRIRCLVFKLCSSEDKINMHERPCVRGQCSILSRAN